VLPSTHFFFDAHFSLVFSFSLSHHAAVMTHQMSQTLLKMPPLTPIRQMTSTMHISQLATIASMPHLRLALPLEA
jgi:hypothetical protein